MKSSCSSPQTGTKKPGIALCTPCNPGPRRNFSRCSQTPPLPPRCWILWRMNLAPGRKELGDALLRNPSLPGQLREWLENTAALFAEAESSESSEAPVPASGRRRRRRFKPVRRDSRREKRSCRESTACPLSEKIKAALTGNQEERMILVRDPQQTGGARRSAITQTLGP